MTANDLSANEDTNSGPLIKVSEPVKGIESAFQVKLNDYRAYNLRPQLVCHKNDRLLVIDEALKGIISQVIELDDSPAILTIVRLSCKNDATPLRLTFMAIVERKLQRWRR